MDIANILENILFNIDSNMLTNYFVFLLVGIFTFTLLLKIFNTMNHLTHYSTALMTTLGILGTFVGIVIGLMHFDVNDIDGSISQLLSGLKVAFITSLVGMALAVLYKILESIINDFKSSGEVGSDEIGIEHLYETMKQQNENLTSLQQVLGENNESSLMGQIKLMRADMGDRHKEAMQHLSLLEPLEQTMQKLNILDSIDKTTKEQAQSFKQFSDTLWIKLQDFADMLSKSATEQVIEALNQVIQDFNNKLTEQFGENFKALNQAVGHLVEWQENYKTQLEELKSAYEQSVQGIERSQKALEAIDQNTSHIPNHMSHLVEVLQVNQHQIDELERHLQAFQDMRDRAIEAIPEIDAKIERTIDGVNVASTKLIEGIDATVTNVVTTIGEGTKELQNGITKSSDMLQNTAENINKTSLQVQQQIESQIKETEKLFHKLESTIEDVVQRTGDGVQKQVEMIDQVAQKEIQNIMEAMGEALTTITGQFTSDYQKLVEEMKQITTAHQQ